MLRMDGSTHNFRNLHLLVHSCFLVGMESTQIYQYWTHLGFGRSSSPGMHHVDTSRSLLDILRVLNLDCTPVQVGMGDHSMIDHHVHLLFRDCLPSTFHVVDRVD